VPAVFLDEPHGPGEVEVVEGMPFSFETRASVLTQVEVERKEIERERLRRGRERGKNRSI
jgi:hypothetical protein